VPGLHRYGSALPDLNAPTTLSDSRRGRRPKRRWGGSPSNHESPFRCAVPTTPADQAGTGVDCFPVRAAGVRIDTFEMLLRLYSRARRIAQPPKVTFVTRPRSGSFASSWLVRACRSRASKYTPIVVPVILIPGLIALKLNRPL
jgi:hypothetical protein